MIVNPEAVFAVSDGYYLNEIRFSALKIDFNLPSKADFLLKSTELSFSILKDSEKTVIVSLTEEYKDSFLGQFSDLLTFSLNDVTGKESQIVKDLLTRQVKLSQVVIENLERYSPIKNVRLSKLNTHQVGSEIKVDNLFFEFLINDQWLPWSFLSDGTKRLFYLINEVSKDVSTVFIEEPELGVHPHQFHSIMLFLKEQAQYKQIILTTHSPYALNVLKETDLDNIIIAKLDKEKGTVCTHLDNKQKDKAIRYLTDVGFLSDYWMHSDLEETDEEA